MYFAANPHLTICCPRDILPQKQRFELKTFPLREYIFNDLCHIFMIFQKQQIYKLVACDSVVRYELVDLLFFNE